jgi:serine/threonine protein kinase
VLELAVQLCGVLTYLHERRYPIVHCDLKPSNILLAEGGRVILLDFGIARFAMEVPPDPPPARIAGTPGYIAPEYARWGFATVRADIYSLGVLLNQLLTGQPPERCGGPLSAWRGRHPLGRLLRQMMEPDQRLRPARASALGAQFEALQREAPRWEPARLPALQLVARRLGRVLSLPEPPTLPRTSH